MGFRKRLNPLVFFGMGFRVYFVFMTFFMMHFLFVFFLRNRRGCTCCRACREDHARG